MICDARSAEPVASLTPTTWGSSPRRAIVSGSRSQAGAAGDVVDDARQRHRLDDRLEVAVEAVLRRACCSTASPAAGRRRRPLGRARQLDRLARRVRARSRRSPGRASSAASTTSWMTRRCSSLVRVGDSPVVPTGTSPSTPPAICSSTRRRSASSSSASPRNGVTSAVMTPVNMAALFYHTATRGGWRALRDSVGKPDQRDEAAFTESAGGGADAAEVGDREAGAAVRGARAAACAARSRSRRGRAAGAAPGGSGSARPAADATRSRRPPRARSRAGRGPRSGASAGSRASSAMRVS